MECICTEKFFLVYLKFKFNEASCIYLQLFSGVAGIHGAGTPPPSTQPSRGRKHCLQLPLSGAGDSSL